MVSLEVEDLGAIDLHFLYSFANIPKKITIKTLRLVEVRFLLYKCGASLHNTISLNVIKSGVQTQARYKARQAC